MMKNYLMKNIIYLMKNVLRGMLISLAQQTAKRVLQTAPPPENRLWIPLAVQVLPNAF